LISALILTLNEEVNLTECLESLGWCDEIVVFDSFSSDRTEEIARAAGARFYQRKFDNYAQQRNAALTEVNYKNPWVLMVDADERIPGELAEEIKTTVTNWDGQTMLYRLRRKDMFKGRWLRRSTGYPTWAGRLFRIGEVQVQRGVHEEYHTSGKVGQLEGHFIHYPFNKGMEYWLERHKKYAAMEARFLLKEIKKPLRWRDLFAGDPARKRKALKRLAYHLPARPLWVFGYLYLFRGGFLDGKGGLKYSVLRAWYERMIDLKVREYNRERKRLSDEGRETLFA